MKRILKVYEYDKEKYSGKRMREGNCTVSKVKENRIFLHSLYSIFHISHYLIFHSCRYFYVIWLLSSEWISARILIREMKLVIVCTAFLHQLLSMISHSYFAYFAFHYFPILRTFFLSTCALLYTVHCISYFLHYFPLMLLLIFKKF